MFFYVERDESVVDEIFDGVEAFFAYVEGAVVVDLVVFGFVVESVCFRKWNFRYI